MCYNSDSLEIVFMDSKETHLVWMFSIFCCPFSPQTSGKIVNRRIPPRMTPARIKRGDCDGKDAPLRNLLDAMWSPILFVALVLHMRCYGLCIAQL